MKNIVERFNEWCVCVAVLWCVLVSDSLAGCTVLSRSVQEPWHGSACHLSGVKERFAWREGGQWVQTATSSPL